MNANELRIGNLVYHNDKIIEIKSLHPQDDDVNDEIPFHAIYGITLTEEWLEKLGFELKEPVLISSWKFSPFCDTITTKCEYLHQLQNLYFALTGEELVVSDAVS
jgi:hypothetical protein